MKFAMVFALALATTARPAAAGDCQLDSDEFKRFDIIMCSSHMCTSCDSQWCMETCQESQKMFPTCSCPSWGGGTYSTQMAHAGKVGDVGDYAPSDTVPGATTDPAAGNVDAKVYFPYIKLSASATSCPEGYEIVTSQDECSKITDLRNPDGTEAQTATWFGLREKDCYVTWPSRGCFLYARDKTTYFSECGTDNPTDNPFSSAKHQRICKSLPGRVTSA